MKSLTPLYCALAIILSQSVVYADGMYKWKDVRGNLQFGDTPPPNANAKALDLPKITIIDNYANQWKPIKFEQAQTNKTPENENEVSNNSSYNKLSFLAPKQGQAIRANDGDVSAMISINPPLKKEHQLVFSIDGKALGKGKARTKNFSNLNRGNHTIVVKVIDNSGKTLKSSSVGFNVLRTNGLNKTQSNNTQNLPQVKSFNDVRQQQVQSGS
jgi:hypothetical protein